MTINDVVARFNTVPFLFVGSGLSRRYLNTPDWKGLLKHFAAQISNDPFVYNSYVSKAKMECYTESVLPVVAELIQRDYDEKWFSTPEIRSQDEAVLQAVMDGVSPFKAEIAKYFRSFTTTVQKYDAEIHKLKDLSVRNIAGVITTNYDCFLEDLFGNYTKYIGQSELIFSPLQGIAEIYKIHGSVEKPDSLVINETDYTVFSSKCGYLAAKLMTIFVEYPIIFLGYSLSDSNIMNIINAIVDCLDENQFAKLEERFVFVEYKEGIVKPEVSTHTVMVKEKPLAMRRIVLSDFMPLYTAMETVKSKIPVRILRRLKQEFYSFTITNTPTANLRVASIDDERIADDELILAIGRPSELGLRGLSGIDHDEWYRNIVTEELEFTADDLLEYAFKKLLSQNSGRLPVHKYLSEATRPFPEAEAVADRYKTLDAIVSNSIRNNRHRLGGYASIQEIWEGTGHDITRSMDLIAYLEEPQIDLDELGAVLKTIFDEDVNVLKNIGAAGRTNIRRVIRIYDCLKWKK